MNANALFRIVFFGAVMTLLGIVSRPAAAATVVIANEDFNTQHIDKRTLQKVFLGRASELDGNRVVLATLRDGPSHKSFTEDYLKMNPQQFKNHWRKMVFAGTGKQPQAFKSEEQLVAYVARTPGAIGYISSATPHTGVKTLDIN